MPNWERIDAFHKLCAVRARIAGRAGGARTRACRSDTRVAASGCAKQEAWKQGGAEVGCGAGFYPAADFQSARAPTLSTKVCGARDVPGRDRLLLLATPPDSPQPEAAIRAKGTTNLLPCPIGWRWILVAHALVRAVSALMPALNFRAVQRRRHECRRGTQECVRHVGPPRIFNGVRGGLWRVSLRPTETCAASNAPVCTTNGLLT